MSSALAPAPSISSLVRPRGPVWTPTELRDLVHTVGTTFRDQLLAQVRFASPQRWWSRLELTEEVEVWLLSWLPGQHTAPHQVNVGRKAVLGFGDRGGFHLAIVAR